MCTFLLSMEVEVFWYWRNYFIYMNLMDSLLTINHRNSCIYQRNTCMVLLGCIHFQNKCFRSIHCRGLIGKPFGKFCMQWAFLFRRYYYWTHRILSNFKKDIERFEKFSSISYRNISRASLRRRVYWRGFLSRNRTRESKLVRCICRSLSHKIYQFVYHSWSCFLRWISVRCRMMNLSMRLSWNYFKSSWSLLLLKIIRSLYLTVILVTKLAMMMVDIVIP